MVNWKDSDNMNKLIGAVVAVHGPLNCNEIGRLLGVTGNAVSLQMQKFRQVGEDLKAGKLGGMTDGSKGGVSTTASATKRKLSPASHSTGFQKKPRNSGKKIKKHMNVDDEDADNIDKVKGVAGNDAGVKEENSYDSNEEEGLI